MALAREKKVEPIRLGIIGSGLAVKWLHWRAFTRLTEEFRIVVCCDVNPQAAEEIARKAENELGSPNVRTTTDYKEVLAAEDVEAVVLALPIHLTAQVILEAARAGKHVISEKPLAGNLEQARELVEALRDFPAVKVEIAENYHYLPQLRKAREWMDAGRIGEPFLIQFVIRSWTDVTKGFATTPWRHDNQYRGGIFADAGVHEAAALRELGGEVEQLQAFARSMHPVMGGQDTVVLNVRFRSGVIANMTFAGSAKEPGEGVYSMDILGTNGAIKMGEGTVTLTEGSGSEAKVLEEFVEPEFDGGYYWEFENFYRALREDAPIVSTPAEAYKDWEIIMRALDSAEERGVILF